MDAGSPSASLAVADVVVVSRHVIARRFPREMVLLNVETGQYHGLNGSAADLFELLQRLGSLSQVARTYAERTGAPVEQVSDDLRVLCDDLRRRRIIAGPA